MGRLIDADVLIEELHHMIEGDVDLTKDYEYMGIDDYIRSMPTAYDVDKVVAELQKSELCHKCKNNHNKISYCATFCDVGKRLDIVKRGGVK